MTTASTEGMSLYYFPSCPYCQRVLQVIDELKLDIELRNIHVNPEFQQEKVKATGKTQVPCLRIEQDGKDQWMYESSDIAAYLHKQFGA